MPRAHGRADLFCGYLDEAMDRFEINTQARKAAFLAQVCVESGHLLYVCEIASGNAYTNRADLGNTLPEAISFSAAHGKETGPFYKGHGLIQVTGFLNHKKCGEALGLDLFNIPTLMMQTE